MWVSVLCVIGRLTKYSLSCRYMMCVTHDPVVESDRLNKRTDRQADSQTNKQTDRQKHRHTDIHSGRKENIRQTDSLADRPKD